MPPVRIERQEIWPSPTLLKFINLAIFLSLALAAGFYVYAANSLSVMGYDLFSAKQRIAELKEESSDLEIRIMDLKSLTYVSGRAQALGLVKADSIRYIVRQDPSVAKAR